MVCKGCFNLCIGAKAHASKSGCPLARSIQDAKCFDCNKVLPCLDKTCRSRSQCLVALWAVLRPSATVKSFAKARQAYGVDDPAYRGVVARIGERDVWVPPHLVENQAMPTPLFLIRSQGAVASLINSKNLLVVLMAAGASARSFRLLGHCAGGSLRGGRRCGGREEG